MEIQDNIINPTEETRYPTNTSFDNSKRLPTVATEGQTAVALQNNAVKQLARQYRGFTPAMAVMSKEPSICEISKKVGIDEVEATFTLHLVALARFLGLSRTLTEEHIDHIVLKLTTEEEYKWLKMADFAILIDRIKSGKYGTFYENFNATKFLECLDKYCEERTDELVRIRQEERNAREFAGIEPSKVNLNYFINNFGHVELTPQEKASVEKKKAERERQLHDSQQKRDISRRLMERAEQIRKERQISIMEAYDRVMKEEGASGHE